MAGMATCAGESGFAVLADIAAALAVRLPLLLLAGCGLVPVDPGVRTASRDPEHLRCIADVYLDYAVLAAHVYGSSTASDLSRALHGVGGKKPIGGVAAVEARRRRETSAAPVLAAVGAGLGSVERQCGALAENEAARGAGAELAASPWPLACSAALQAAIRADRVPDDAVQPYDDSWPDAGAACEAGAATQGTPVPFTEVTRAAGWQREPDIERYATTHEWRVFVPGLAIEVWSRPTAARREYAIVFRGTADSGGWLSDLRILTVLLPVFWDQYRQAEWSVRQIVEQIRERSLREWLGSLPPGTAGTEVDLAAFDAAFPDITAVGHSLGAGLAKFVYYRVREVNRVVGFNPSPIDGSRTMVRLEEREDVMRQKDHRHRPRPDCTRRVTATDSWTFLESSDAGMSMLYEQGEILSTIAPCVSGPHWGQPGDPVSRCQAVNLSRFDAAHPFRSLFEQHGMNRLACLLAASRPAPNKDRCEGVGCAR